MIDAAEYDMVIRKLMELDYYHHLTVGEFADDMIAQRLFGPNPMPVYYRQLLESRIRAIRNEGQSRRIVSWAKVNETRAAFMAAGQPYGDKAVADKLGATVTTVRRVRREGQRSADFDPLTPRLA